MGVVGTDNRAYDNSEEVTSTESTSQHHCVQIDDYDDTDAINMMTNSYEYYAKLNNMYSETRETEDALESIKINNSYSIDICEEDSKPDLKMKTSNSTNDIEKSEGYCKDSYSNSCNCDSGVGTTSEPQVKTRSLSRCSVGSCSDIVANTSLGRIYYNCNRSDPRLNLNIFDTTLTSPVPNDDTCCDCECQTTSSVTNDVTIIENTNIKEKALVEPVKSSEGQSCCRCSYQQYESNVLTRSITEHSIKSTTDDLPSYRSLIAFRLKDCPPNYESVTGIRVNVDEIRKEINSYTRQRLRREVRNCSDLNSSAKRLLVLMAAIIVAICVVMIILTI